MLSMYEFLAANAANRVTSDLRRQQQVRNGRPLNNLDNDRKTLIEFQSQLGISLSLPKIMPTARTSPSTKDVQQQGQVTEDNQPIAGH